MTRTLAYLIAIYNDGYDAGRSTYRATAETGVYLAPAQIGIGVADRTAWDEWHLGYNRGWAAASWSHKQTERA